MSKNRFFFVLGCLLVTMVSSVQASGNQYKAALRHLDNKDSVEALLAFQDCTNYPSCNDSSYLYLGELQWALNKSIEGQITNYRIFLEKGLGDSKLQFKLASLLTAQNKRGAEKYLKILLKDPVYKISAGQLLVKYYQMNHAIDSLLKYRVLHSKSVPFNQFLIQKNLKLALAKNDLNIMKKLGEELLQVNRQDGLAHYALAVVNYKNKRMNEAVQHAMLASPEIAGNYQHFRPRLYALYVNERWQLLIDEASMHKSEIRKNEQESYFCARALLALGRKDEAIKVFNRLYQSIFFKFPDPLLAAQLFFEYDQYQESKNLLFQVEGEKDVKIRSMLGDIYVQEDSLFQASVQYGECVKNSNDTWYHQKYGDLTLKLGQLSESRKSFEFLHKLDPADRGYIQKLHHIYQRQGNVTELMRLLPLRIELEPENDALRYELARIYIRRGQWAQAANLLKKNYEAAPDNYSVGIIYASALQKSSDHKQALLILKNLNVQEPANKEVLRNILKTPESILEIKEKIFYTGELLQLEPKNISLRKQYVHMLSRTGQTNNEQYIQALILLYKQTPSDTRILNMIVNELLAIGRKKDAEPYLENLVDMDNDYGNLIALADIYEEDGKQTKALGTLQRAFTIKQTGDVSLRIYNSMISMGDSSRALDFLSRRSGRAIGNPGVMIALSRHVENTNPNASLQLAKKSFNLSGTRSSAFQYSKMAMLCAVSDGEFMAVQELPWQKFSFAGDSSLLLNGLSAYCNKSFNKAESNLLSITHPNFRTQSRTALFLSLQEQKQWPDLYRLAKEISVQNLSDLEFQASGEALYHLKRYSELKENVLSHPSYLEHHPQSLVYLALAYFNLKQFSEAADLLSTVSPEKKWYRDCLWAQGYSLFMGKDYREAEKVWARGEEYLSHWDSLYVYRSMGQLTLADTTQAINILVAGLEHHPKSIAILSQLSIVHFNRKTEAYGLEYALKVQALDLKDLENKKRLAKIYMIQKQPEKVAALFNLSGIGQDLDALLLLAEAQLANANFEDAIQTCAKALAISKKRPQSYLYLSQAYEQSGQFQESQKYFRKYSTMVSK
ncbi:MAG: hypothetical protein HQK83_13270 [Fibrobacteria bacterium]|nr:hypothetical protein [Fibrobacteria bacterium]